MDLFALLTSLAGNHDQSSFAGGMTYQDALAHFHNTDIEKDVSIDPGPISSIGCLARHAGTEMESLAAG